MAAFDACGEGEYETVQVESRFKQNHMTDLHHIRQILGNHDNNDKISSQIVSCLQNDEISLQTLIEFDDVSLRQMIDSWNIDTYPKKPFLIRGLLIKGIKNLCNSKTDQNHTETIVTENEIKMMKSMADYKHHISSLMTKIENNSHMNDNIKKTYKEAVDKEVNYLVSLLQRRKVKLTSKIDKLFEAQSEKLAKNMLHLQEIEAQIDNTKNIYDKNMSKFKYDKASDIDINNCRSEINCQMIGNTLKECKEIENNKMEAIGMDFDESVECKVEFDNKMIDDIEKLIGNLGIVELKHGKFNNQPANNPNPIASNQKNNNSEADTKHDEDADTGVDHDRDDIPGVEETTIIDKVVVLESNKIHKYKNLKVSANGVLTVPNWDERSNTGGILRLQCESLVLESNSEINLDGKGYKGGKKGSYQGYSYNSITINDPSLKNGCKDQNGASRVNSNYSHGGGGGGDSTSGLWTGAGGGGGYGSNGKNGGGIGGGKGGLSYGDLKLANIYLGSGGGASFDYRGTNGGGAVIIVCQKSIIIEENAKISVNGENVTDARNKWSGCGSGGSIYLKSPKIINNGLISAVGGKNKPSGSNYQRKDIRSGSGGNGRIRIDCSKENLRFVEYNIDDKNGAPTRQSSTRSIFSNVFRMGQKNNDNVCTGVIQPGIGYLHFL